MEENPILVNEEPLNEAFIPTRLLHREGQLKEIARSLKPALRNRSITNIFLVGPTGTGKTLVMKWILQDQFKNISTYVNCWNCRTSHKVLQDILLQLGFVVHGRESTTELVKKFEKSVRKKIIVCLDEVDQLKDTKVLYTLARKECGLILISNHSFILNSIDSRIRSSLLLNEVEFRPYSHAELFDILKDRVGFAFREGSISDGVIRLASVFAKGDARVGLQTLRVAARNAEGKGMSKITVEEVKGAIKGARKFKLSYVLKKLNVHQMLIYRILKKRVKMNSGELYKEYSKLSSKPVIDRAYRNYMKRMVQLGLVAMHGKGRWKRYEIVI